MTVSTMSLRKEVLSLYKKTIRLSNGWVSRDATSTESDRMYMKHEARSLFKANKNLSSEGEIREHLREGEARIEIAVHYQNPYPRPVHLPTYTLLSKQKLKSERDLRRDAIPIYMKSLFENANDEKSSK